MRLHISGPMTGVHELNRPLFARVSGLLVDMGHAPWNPHEEIHPDTGYRPALARNLAFLCDEAEGQVVLPRWQESPGSFAENQVARACKLPIWSFESGAEIFRPVNTLASARGTLRALGARS